MLNRKIIAQTPITKTRKDYHNKIVYLPLITTGNIKSSSLLSTSFGNNTDAILFEERDNHLDSRVDQQKSFRQLPTKKSRKIRTYSNLDLCHSSEYNPAKVNLTATREQQLVNSKTNVTIEYYCLKNKSRASPRLISKSKMTNPIYYLTAFLLTLCAISIAPISVQADKGLTSALERLKISPDIIKDPDNLYLIKLDLNGNKKPGDQVSAEKFRELNLPKITWEGSYSEDRTTVMIVDLDRKPNSTQNIYNQFTSLNIPGTNLGAGQTIVAFEPPIASCNPSTKHRILLLALRQRQNIDLKDVFYMSASSGQSQGRENFDLSKFIDRHRLELVAANVLLATGETNGVCSGSMTIHSIQSISSILFVMVMLITAFGVRTIST